MARRKDTARIEPKFGGESDGGLRASADDRATGTGKSRRAKAEAAPKGKTAGKGERRRGERPRRSLLSRIVRRSVYWGFIVCLWLGIGAAGLVGYYAAELPGASEWRVPDRPPNIQILAVDGTLIGNRGDTGGESVRIEQLPGLCAECGHRHRGPALPLAFRRRPGRPDPRRRAQRLRRRRGAGRLDADPAARQEHVPDAGALAEAQGAGGGARGLAGDANTPRTRSWRCT